jgi:hypothetical protein
MNLAAPNPTAANLDVLPGFRPFAALWAGDAPAYPSESAARWEFSRKKIALVAAGAVAFHRGRWFVHAERFPAVIERIALDEAGRRTGCLPSPGAGGAQQTIGGAS